MKTIDIAAYNINGSIYYRRGKPNAKEKNQLWKQIQNGEKVEKWGGIQKDTDFKKRGLFTKTGNSNSPLHETNKQNIGELIQWLQSTTQT